MWLSMRDEAATRDSEHARPRYALRSKMPTARKVAALSQMEQSAQVGGGCSQVVPSGSDAGVDAGGRSATRARARCACKSPRIGR